MNSRIILAKNINMDRDYKNVLSYSSSQLLELLLSSGHLVNQAFNYSFINGYDDNNISVGFTYQECLNSNYIAFQNPNYANKWFFAFITDLKYISDRSCQITFQVDAWATWFDDWNRKPCFTIREHVSNDTIGLHTVPENVEMGEYISNGFVRDNNLDDLVYIIQTTEWVSGDDKPLATNFGGVFNAGGAYICDNISQVVNIIKGLDDGGKGDAVQNVYVVPKKIVNNTSGSLQYSGQNNPVTYNIEVDKQFNLNGYTPKNKKLLTYPYNYLILDNNNGTTNILQYEMFSSDKCVFEVAGVPTVGGSIKCVPLNYKGENRFQQEGIMSGKFPTCGWVNDLYINWITQNSVNLSLGIASTGLNLIGGIGLMATGGGAVAGAGSVVNSTLSIASQVSQIYQHSLIPNSAKGNINGGDINTCYDMNKFYFIKMSIKQEYARIIDDYFSRYGYKINRMKVPEMISRKLFNYIQIGESEEIGDGNVPVTFMEKINQACRNGVTIWHDHENMFNFNNDNSIV